MPKDLLIEIGCEELPAGAIPRALSILKERVEKRFEKAGFERVVTYGTPRRLALIVLSLNESEGASTTEVRGPQKSAAYGPDNSPTKALLGFMQAQGVTKDDLYLGAFGKGEYVFAKKTTPGQKTAKALQEALPEIISEDLFAKSMRWGSHDLRFSRPIHWVLAIYGSDTIEFDLGHVKSSNTTCGHRFLGQKAPITINSASEYIDALRNNFVLVDPEERKAEIQKGLKTLAGSVGGEILQDDGLLTEVAYLTEYPQPLMGSFDRAFLELPKEVVVNAMREHQRYFSLKDPSGSLLPYFITIANTSAPDADVIRKGNERVLRARLNDAKFFFEQDSKTKLAHRTASLKGVIFQAKLGTSFEKVERFLKLSIDIGATLGLCSPTGAQTSAEDFLKDDANPAGKTCSEAELNRLILGRSATLAKADLTSGMVGEFPNLQGLMGSIYAKKDNEHSSVCTAIVEHYMPIASGARLPASWPGAVISIADKLDTICACFGVGLIPTGAQDPYALRRQSLGILAIIQGMNLKLRLDDLVKMGVTNVGQKLTRNKDEVVSDVTDFFKERFKNQLLSGGSSFDSIDAVLSVDWFDVNDAPKRIQAIEGFKKHPDCPSLVIAFKRVSNILKGQVGLGDPDTTLFIEPEEKALYETARDIRPKVEECRRSGEYALALTTLASIRGVVDVFFDKVMVMCEDPAGRKNRLSLLNMVRGLYFTMADLSKLSA